MGKFTDIKELQGNPRVERAYHEPGNGYWADLNPGWRCIITGAHTCHTETLERLIEAGASH